MKRCSNALLEKCKSKLQDTTSNLLGWLISTSTTKCFRGCGEKVPSFTAWECKLVQPLWNGMRVPQKIKHRGTIWPSSLSSGYLPENLKTFVHKDMCTPMFIAALFTETKKTWRQLKCPFIDDWMKKMWYVSTMEYYSAIRKDEILPFVTTCIDLENIMQVK